MHSRAVALILFACVSLPSSMALSNSCYQTIDIDSNKEFTFVDWNLGGFASFMTNMSCFEAEATKNRLVLDNPHFMTLADFQTYETYSLKIDALTKELDDGFEGLDIKNGTDLRKAIVGDIITGVGGVATVIGCVGIWGAVCGIGLLATGGSLATDGLDGDDDIAFDLALRYLSKASEERKMMMEESHYSSIKSNFQSFVISYCDEVLRQCAKR